MAKGNTILVQMRSTGTFEDGRPTNYSYVKKKNPRQLTEKLKMRKYDPRIQKHVEFEEKSMPRHKK